MEHLLEHVDNLKWKAIKVIESCENSYHTKCAEKYIKLLNKKLVSEVSGMKGEARKAYEKLISSVDNLLTVKLKISKEKFRTRF